MTALQETDSRAGKVADILRPLGRGALSKQLAVLAANLLGVLVLNDVDVSAPRWKREWLEPAAKFCRVRRTLLETVPRFCISPVRLLRCCAGRD
jgi:hypothetical protein